MPTSTDWGEATIEALRKITENEKPLMSREELEELWGGPLE